MLFSIESFQTHKSFWKHLLLDKHYQELRSILLCHPWYYFRLLISVRVIEWFFFFFGSLIQDMLLCCSDGQSHLACLGSVMTSSVTCGKEETCGYLCLILFYAVSSHSLFSWHSLKQVVFGVSSRDSSNLFLLQQDVGLHR